MLCAAFCTLVYPKTASNLHHSIRKYSFYLLRYMVCIIFCQTFRPDPPARLHCYQYMMLLNLPVSYDSRHIVECQFFRNHTFHASVRGRRPYGIKDPAASNGVSNLQRCRAAGYLTLAAVAKCLQAATWLVARGNKSKTAHRVGSGSQSPAAHTDNKKGTAPANTECCSLP